MSERIEAV